MGHVSTDLGAGNRRAACVCKQVEHFYLPSAALYQRLHDIPIHSLLGKKPRVLKSHEFKGEFKPLARYDEIIGDTSLIFPSASALIRANIFCVYLSAVFSQALTFPYHLRIGSQQNEISPPLQLLTVAGSKYLIVFPIVGNSYHRSDRRQIFATVMTISSPLMSKVLQYPSILPSTSISQSTPAQIDLSSLSTCSHLPLP